MSEQWRPVVGWEGYYEVSDHGRVRSLDRTVGHLPGHSRTAPGRVLRPQRSSRNGRYRKVTLRRDGSATQRTVHRLVLEAFVGPCPDGMECLHGDDDPLNNRLPNLSWGTHAKNLADMAARNRSKRKWTHCIHGHEFTPENTYWNPASGNRQCRSCNRARPRRNKKKVA